MILSILQTIAIAAVCICLLLMAYSYGYDKGNSEGYKQGIIYAAIKNIEVITKKKFLKDKKD